MPKQNISIESGKTYEMNYRHPADMTGGTLFFTVKSVESDDDADDSTALITKDVGSFTEDGTLAEWTLTDSDTNLEKGKYYYDIVFEDSDGKSLPSSWYGEVRVDKHPTNRNI